MSCQQDADSFLPSPLAKGTVRRLPCSSNSKESACEAGDQGSVPGLGSSSGEGNGNPLQNSCLENSMDREAWWTTGRGVAKSRTRLSDSHTVLPSPPAKATVRNRLQELKVLFEKDRERTLQGKGQIKASVARLRGSQAAPYCQFSPRLTAEERLLSHPFHR